MDIAIGLGSNAGDRRAFLSRALAAIDREFGVWRSAALYETDPMYVLDQPAFLNSACIARCDWGPLECLARLKAIERTLGRSTQPRYGPREIDLDLLSFGPLSYTFQGGGRTVLQVPHPLIPERRFVLEPLAEIAPELVLPGLGRVADLLAATEPQSQSVRRLDDAELSLPGA